MRRFLIAVMVTVSLWAGGCRISRHIVDLTPPAGLPPLQELESHLDYVDPDAGQPDYVRVD